MNSPAVIPTPVQKIAVPADRPTKVRLQSVMKTYQSRAVAQMLALSDVNLNIRAGEFISLLGPSGCGKTTLLKIIGGLVSFDDGIVEIDRTPVVEPSAKVALVFQNFGLFPWRTVRANVEFGLEAAGVHRKQRREIANEYASSWSACRASPKAIPASSAAACSSASASPARWRSSRKCC